ncbi:Plasma membrane t-SNARE, secretory vesicle fusion [Apophysomyces sp. BC1015]|nr:Plasma membrane t-SNARE, secretory vesicle fusion [Apophysomyces sp. BC1015]
MLNPVDRYPAQLPPRTGARDTMDEQDVYEMHNVKTDISTLEGFFDEVERLRNEISIVSDNVDKITTLHKSTLVSFNEQQTRELSNDLERIQNGTRKKTVEIKNRIQDLELSNARLPNDSNTQIRRTQTATLRKRFLEVIQRYQDIERTYQQKYRQHIVRQIHIVKPDATQDEIDAVIDSDQPPQLFSQSLMQASRMGEAREVLSEVQSRHDDIKRIEKTIVVRTSNLRVYEQHT